MCARAVRVTESSGRGQSIRESLEHKDKAESDKAVATQMRQECSIRHQVFRGQG